MKRVVFLLFMLIISISCFAQQSNSSTIYRLDSTHLKFPIVDGISLFRQSVCDVYHQYDTNGLNTMNFAHCDLGSQGQFLDVFQTNLFDANGNCIKQQVAQNLYASWLNVWDTVKVDMTYDAQNRLISRNVMFMDTSGTLIPMINEKWVFASARETYTKAQRKSMAWDSIRSEIYKNVQGNPSYKVTSRYLSNNWLKSDSVFYFYSGNMLDSALEYYSSNGSFNSPPVKKTFQFNSLGNRFVTKTYSLVNNGVLVDSTSTNLDTTLKRDDLIIPHVYLDFFWYRDINLWDMNVKIDSAANFGVDNSMNNWFRRDSIVYHYSQYSTIGIEENYDSEMIHVFPNPTNGKIEFKSQQQIRSVTVINLQGMVVYETRLEDNYKQLDLSHLNKGLYILRFKYDTGVFSKIVLKK